MSPFPLIDVAQLRERVSLRNPAVWSAKSAALFPLPQAELQHLRYVRSELNDRIGLPVVGTFLPGQVKSPSELIEQQRAIRVLIISTSLAVVISFAALVAANALLSA